MDNQCIKQFSYFPFWLWIDACIFLFTFPFMIICLFLIDNQPVGSIFGTLIAVFFFKSIQKTIRNLYRSFAKKPAIEITEQYYVSQIKEPVIKILYLLDPKGKSVRVTLNYIKGDNHKIYEEIERFWTKKSNYY